MLSSTTENSSLWPWFGKKKKMADYTGGVSKHRGVEEHSLSQSHGSSTTGQNGGKVGMCTSSLI